MKRYTTAIIYSVLSLLLIGTASIAVLLLNPPTQADIAPQATVSAPQPPTVDELFKLVNEERAKVGVAPLILDERLNKSAQQKADDMDTNNYYAHVDKNGRHGYDIAHELAPDICMNPSENLMRSGDINSSEAIVTGWLGSPTHRKAMLDSKFVYTGFGINGNKITQHFC